MTETHDAASPHPALAGIPDTPWGSDGGGFHGRILNGRLLAAMPLETRTDGNRRVVARTFNGTVDGRTVSSGTDLAAVKSALEEAAGREPPR